MRSLNLYKEVEVSVKELHCNNSLPHKHHFFELIYVLEGRGIHLINKNNYIYSEGDIFLLTPEDAHTFKTSEPTRFCIIDFTKSLFSRNGDKQENKVEASETFYQLEYIFHNHHNIRGNIISAKEKPVFQALMGQLMLEKENTSLFSESIIQNTVILLLNLIARNIQENITESLKVQYPKSRVHEITTYIQQYIYNKELIKISAIAAHFNKTPDHISRYFKAQTGVTIKDYMLQYKLELAKSRLRYSDLTISEIAYELNFTDESHLNKLFKHHFEKTAKQYREIKSL